MQKPAKMSPDGGRRTCATVVLMFSNLAEQRQNLMQAGLPQVQAEAIIKAINDAVAPLVRKLETVTALQPTLEVLEERMKHMATDVQLNAVIAQMNKLHGETMNRMGKMEGRVGVVESRLGERIGRGEGRMSKIEADLAIIKWILSVFVAPLMVAMALGIIKLVFFP